ncbi:hypothetical protein BLNAU_6077 [Blattamonas nauphoetae]|uniref:Uncharacterized protein n=1 Tax=Blattamonas nauphoetae TaxID=2049346 RepID=A0ABQ9Y528_9EUKA|nr:hypothetical protein BLNAU_6077 [Blattamonas nauphoetae]
MSLHSILTVLRDSFPTCEHTSLFSGYVDAFSQISELWGPKNTESRAVIKNGTINDGNAAIELSESEIADICDYSDALNLDESTTATLYLSWKDELETELKRPFFLYYLFARQDLLLCLICLFTRSSSPIPLNLLHSYSSLIPLPFSDLKPPQSRKFDEKRFRAERRGGHVYAATANLFSNWIMKLTDVISLKETLSADQPDTPTTSPTQEPPASGGTPSSAHQPKLHFSFSSTFEAEQQHYLLLEQKTSKSLMDNNSDSDNSHSHNAPSKFLSDSLLDSPAPPLETFSSRMHHTTLQGEASEVTMDSFSPPLTLADFMTLHKPTGLLRVIFHNFESLIQLLSEIGTSLSKIPSLHLNQMRSCLLIEFSLLLDLFFACTMNGQVQLSKEDVLYSIIHLDSILSRLGSTVSKMPVLSDKTAFPSNQEIFDMICSTTSQLLISIQSSIFNSFSFDLFAEQEEPNESNDLESSTPRSFSLNKEEITRLMTHSVSSLLNDTSQLIQNGKTKSDIYCGLALNWSLLVMNWMRESRALDKTISPPSSALTTAAPEQVETPFTIISALHQTIKDNLLICLEINVFSILSTNWTTSTQTRARLEIGWETHEPILFGVGCELVNLVSLFCRTVRFSQPLLSEPLRTVLSSLLAKNQQATASDPLLSSLSLLPSAAASILPSAPTVTAFLRSIVSVIPCLLNVIVGAGRADPNSIWSELLTLFPLNSVVIRDFLDAALLGVRRKAQQPPPSTCLVPLPLPSSSLLLSAFSSLPSFTLAVPVSSLLSHGILSTNDSSQQIPTQPFPATGQTKNVVNMSLSQPAVTFATYKAEPPTIAQTFSFLQFILSSPLPLPSTFPSSFLPLQSVQNAALIGFIESTKKEEVEEMRLIMQEEETRQLQSSLSSSALLQSSVINRPAVVPSFILNSQLVVQITLSKQAPVLSALHFLLSPLLLVLRTSQTSSHLTTSFLASAQHSMLFLRHLVDLWNEESVRAQLESITTRFESQKDAHSRMNETRTHFFISQLKEFENELGGLHLVAIDGTAPFLSFLITLLSSLSTLFASPHPSSFTTHLLSLLAESLSLVSTLLPFSLFSPSAIVSLSSSFLSVVKSESFDRGIEESERSSAKEGTKGLEPETFLSAWLECTAALLHQIGSPLQHDPSQKEFLQTLLPTSTLSLPSRHLVASHQHVSKGDSLLFSSSSIDSEDMTNVMDFAVFSFVSVSLHSIFSKLPLFSSSLVSSFISILAWIVMSVPTMLTNYSTLPFPSIDILPPSSNTAPTNVQSSSTPYSNLALLGSLRGFVMNEIVKDRFLSSSLISIATDAIFPILNNIHVENGQHETDRTTTDEQNTRDLQTHIAEALFTVLDEIMKQTVHEVEERAGGESKKTTKSVDLPSFAASSLVSPSLVVSAPSFLSLILSSSLSLTPSLVSLELVSIVISLSHDPSLRLRTSCFSFLHHLLLLSSLLHSPTSLVLLLPRKMTTLIDSVFDSFFSFAPIEFRDQIEQSSLSSFIALQDIADPQSSHLLNAVSSFIVTCINTQPSFAALLFRPSSSFLSKCLEFLSTLDFEVPSQFLACILLFLKSLSIQFQTDQSIMTAISTPSVFHTCRLLATANLDLSSSNELNPKALLLPFFVPESVRRAAEKKETRRILRDQRRSLSNQSKTDTEKKAEGDDTAKPTTDVEESPVLTEIGTKRIRLETRDMFKGAVTEHALFDISFINDDWGSTREPISIGEWWDGYDVGGLQNRQQSVGMGGERGFVVSAIEGDDDRECRQGVHPIDCVGYSEVGAGKERFGPFSCLFTFFFQRTQIASHQSSSEDLSTLVDPFTSIAAIHKHLSFLISSFLSTSSLLPLLSFVLSIHHISEEEIRLKRTNLLANPTSSLFSPSVFPPTANPSLFSPFTTSLSATSPLSTFTTLFSSADEFAFHSPSLAFLLDAFVGRMTEIPNKSWVDKIHELSLLTNTTLSFSFSLLSSISSFLSFVSLLPVVRSLTRTTTDINDEASQSIKDWMDRAALVPSFTSLPPSLHTLPPPHALSLVVSNSVSVVLFCPIVPPLTDPIFPTFSEYESMLADEFEEIDGNSAHSRLLLVAILSQFNLSLFSLVEKEELRKTTNEEVKLSAERAFSFSALFDVSSSHPLLTSQLFAPNRAEEDKALQKEERAQIQFPPLHHKLLHTLLLSSLKQLKLSSATPILSSCVTPLLSSLSLLLPLIPSFSSLPPSILIHPRLWQEDQRPSLSLTRSTTLLADLSPVAELDNTPMDSRPHRSSLLPSSLTPLHPTTSAFALTTPAHTLTSTTLSPHSTDSLFSDSQNDLSAITPTHSSLSTESGTEINRTQSIHVHSTCPPECERCQFRSFALNLLQELFGLFTLFAQSEVNTLPLTSAGTLPSLLMLLVSETLEAVPLSNESPFLLLRTVGPLLDSTANSTPSISNECTENPFLLKWKKCDSSIASEQIHEIFRHHYGSSFLPFFSTLSSIVSSSLSSIRSEFNGKKTVSQIASIFSSSQLETRSESLLLCLTTVSSLLASHPHFLRSLSTSGLFDLVSSVFALFSTKVKVDEPNNKEWNRHVAKKREERKKEGAKTGKKVKEEDESDIESHSLFFLVLLHRHHSLLASFSTLLTILFLFLVDKEALEDRPTESHTRALSTSTRNVNARQNEEGGMEKVERGKLVVDVLTKNSALIALLASADLLSHILSCVCSISLSVTPPHLFHTLTSPSLNFLSPERQKEVSHAITSVRFSVSRISPPTQRNTITEPPTPLSSYSIRSSAISRGRFRHADEDDTPVVLSRAQPTTQEKRKTPLKRKQERGQTTRRTEIPPSLLSADIVTQEQVRGKEEVDRKKEVLATAELQKSDTINDFWSKDDETTAQEIQLFCAPSPFISSSPDFIFASTANIFCSVLTHFLPSSSVGGLGPSFRLFISVLSMFVSTLRPFVQDWIVQSAGLGINALPLATDTTFSLITPIGARSAQKTSTPFGSRSDAKRSGDHRSPVLVLLPCLVLGNQVGSPSQLSFGHLLAACDILDSAMTILSSSVSASMSSSVGSRTSASSFHSTSSTSQRIRRSSQLGLNSAISSRRLSSSHIGWSTGKNLSALGRSLELSGLRGRAGRDNRMASSTTSSVDSFGAVGRSGGQLQRERYGVDVVKLKNGLLEIVRTEGDHINDQESSHSHLLVFAEIRSLHISLLWILLWCACEGLNALNDSTADEFRKGLVSWVVDEAEKKKHGKGLGERIEDSEVLERLISLGEIWM